MFFAVVSQGPVSIRQSRGPGGTRAHTVGNPEFMELEYFTKDSNHAYPLLRRVTLCLPKLLEANILTKIRTKAVSISACKINRNVRDSRKIVSRHSIAV